MASLWFNLDLTFVLAKKNPDILSGRGWGGVGVETPLSSLDETLLECIIFCDLPYLYECILLGNAGSPFLLTSKTLSMKAIYFQSGEGSEPHTYLSYWDCGIYRCIYVYIYMSRKNMWSRSMYAGARAMLLFFVLKYACVNLRLEKQIWQ